MILLMRYHNVKTEIGSLGDWLRLPSRRLADDGFGLSERCGSDEIADRHSLFLGGLDDHGSFLFGVVGEDSLSHRVV